MVQFMLSFSWVEVKENITEASLEVGIVTLKVWPILLLVLLPRNSNAGGWNRPLFNFANSSIGDWHNASSARHLRLGRLWDLTSVPAWRVVSIRFLRLDLSRWEWWQRRWRMLCFRLDGGAKAQLPWVPLPVLDKGHHAAPPSPAHTRGGPQVQLRHLPQALHPQALRQSSPQDHPRHPHRALTPGSTALLLSSCSQNRTIATGRRWRLAVFQTYSQTWK